MEQRNYKNAVFNIDVGAFIDLLEKEPIDIFSDVDVFKPCPVYGITQCWEIVLAHPEEWMEEVRDTIAENKRRNLEIKRIFEDLLGEELKPLDFNNFDLGFPKEYTYKDFFDATLDEMFERGYRTEDLDLYIAVRQLNFIETERLLKLGADPRCIIEEEQSGSCIEVVEDECSFLEIELAPYYLNQDEEDISGYSQAFEDLFMLAANVCMSNLLSKYVPRNRT